MTNARLIFSLYRTKLRLCIRENYVPGQWINPDKLFGWTKNEHHIAAQKSINFKKMKKLKNNNILGNFIWNTVRWKYKANKNTSDIYQIDANIDEAFEGLRIINTMLYTLRPQLTAKSNNYI